MPTKKASSSNEKPKKPTSRSKALSKKRTVRKNSEPLMKEKLDEVLEEVQTLENKILTEKRSVKRSFPWWPLVSLILVIVLAGVLLYENNAYFKQNLNNLAGSLGLKPSTSVGQQEPAEIFEMKLKIVYNEADPQQRSAIENYLGNIESNLPNTRVVPTWVDKNSLEAQDIIEKIDAKYLPIFITDETIEKHPLYYEFSSAVENKNGDYFFKSEGMEYLQTPPVADARYNGANPERAALTIVEYASFTCGYCKQMHPVLRELEKAYGGEVSFVTKNFDRGGVDSVLAQAAECAADQGRYDQMVDALYDRQSDLIATIQAGNTTEEGLTKAINDIAVVAKVNATALNQCIADGKYAEKITRQTQEGQSFGVMGTPSFFIGNKFIGGAIPQENFEEIIKEQLAK
jgi:protein-disulfide isomerase